MNEKEPTIAQEAGLPDSWHPIDSKPIIPSELGAPGGPNKMAPLFSGPINPTGQHDVFFVGTQVGSPLIAKLPLTPMSASGLPTIGSAIQSGSSTTSSEIISVIAQGPNGAIQFNNGGALDGSVLFNWNNTSNIFTVTGTVSITGTTTMTGPLFVIGTAAATIFNAGTGFEVGGAAASGHYLRGNGTNFVSATLSGSDILAGIVGVTYGGTGANLSGTGGAHQVLRQSTLGGAVTVSQLSYSDISGSLVSIPIWNTTVQTTTYTAAAGDMVLADTSGGGFTVTLPASSANTNLSIRIKKTSSDGNLVTIGRTGSDLIDGQTSQTFFTQYNDIEVTSDGAGNWWIA